jgi:hypothetical protein
MSDFTKIQWAHKTFNPWIGCAKVSPGCAHPWRRKDNLPMTRAHFLLRLPALLAGMVVAVCLLALIATGMVVGLLSDFLCWLNDFLFQGADQGQAVLEKFWGKKPKGIDP